MARRLRHHNTATLHFCRNLRDVRGLHCAWHLSCTNTPNPAEGVCYQVPLLVPRLFMREEANPEMLRRT